MEVHAHTHTPRKKWTHYFWEFLMLFLAVFCGFLAENFREHQVEHQREKEYIRSMIADLSMDTLNFRLSIERNQTMIAGSDSLLSILDEANFKTNDVRELYFLANRYTRNISPVGFTKRTMTQLKNAGGLRLIRSKAASDSIIEYDVFSSGVEIQGAAVSEFSIKSEFFFQQIFDSKYFRLFNKEKLHDSSLQFRNTTYPISLLTDDSLILKQYANSVSARRGVMNGYISFIRNILNYASSLINLLKKEYHLK